MEILEAKFFKKCNFFLGKSMSKFMSNDVRSPAADRRSSKTLFSKRIYSALVIRLLFNILKKYSYHVFPCKESEKFHQKNYQTLNFFLLIFCSKRTFPIVQRPLKGLQNNPRTWLTNATRTLPFIIPSTTMPSFGLRVFYSSWSAL